MRLDQYGFTIPDGWGCRSLLLDYKFRRIRFYRWRSASLCRGFLLRDFNWSNDPEGDGANRFSGLFSTGDIGVFCKVKYLPEVTKFDQGELDVQTFVSRSLVVDFRFIQDVQSGNQIFPVSRCSDFGVFFPVAFHHFKKPCYFFVFTNKEVPQELAEAVDDKVTFKTFPVDVII